MSAVEDWNWLPPIPRRRQLDRLRLVSLSRQVVDGMDADVAAAPGVRQWTDGLRRSVHAACLVGRMGLVRLRTLPHLRKAVWLPPAAGSGAVLRVAIVVGIAAGVLGLPSSLAYQRYAVDVPAETAAPLLIVSGGGAHDVAGASLEGAGSDPFGVHNRRGFATGADALAWSAPAAAALHPSLNVIVQGGEADVAQPAGTVERATLHMIDRLRRQIDASRSITVIGPFPSAHRDRALLRVRDELAAASANKRVRFIDPIAHGLRRGQPDLRQQLAVLLELHDR